MSEQHNTATKDHMTPENEINDVIRQALREAADEEKKKKRFKLSGRGHEPRITLDIRLAAILRNEKLPSVWISGYGANKHYPERLFTRAAVLMHRQLGWLPLGFRNDKVYRVDKEP